MQARAIEDDALGGMDRAELEYCAEGYENLRVAIVQQAAEDMAAAIRALERYRKREDEAGRKLYYAAEKLHRDCTNFFRSPWFEFLTSSAIDGEDVIEEVTLHARHPKGRSAGGIASAYRRKRTH